MHPNNPRLSVSTWSLHHTLGQPPFYGVEQGTTVPTNGHHPDALPLLELPARLAAFGIHTLEICHFHLPSRDSAYLAELNTALTDAGVELFSLLVDAGDISDPVNGVQDAAWIRQWFDVAAQLGSRCVRVDAGKQPPTEAALQTSISRMAALADEAEALGIRVMTENWHDLLSTPEAVTRLLDALEGRVGFCLDFGNWQGETKYPAFETIAPYAESCHTKADFSATGHIDRQDYVRCLDITAAANFSGPYTLIFDYRALDEWQGLAIEKEIVAPYLNRNTS